MSSQAWPGEQRPHGASVAIDHSDRCVIYPATVATGTSYILHPHCRVGLPVQPVPYSRAMDETLPKRPQSAYSDSFHSSPRRRSRSKSPPRQKYPLRPPSAPQQRRSGLVCAAGHLSEEADQHMRAQRRPHSAMPYTRTPYYPDTGHTRKEDGQFQGLDMDTMPRK